MDGYRVVVAVDSAHAGVKEAYVFSVDDGENITGEPFTLVKQSPLASAASTMACVDSRSVRVGVEG